MTDQPSAETVLASFAHINDTHFCPLGMRPAGRTETYHQDTAWEWRNFRDAIVAEGVRAVIHTGDMFHFKKPKLYEPRDLLFYSAACQSLDVPIYFVPGNHDLLQSSMDNFGVSPLKALQKMTGNLHNVMDVVLSETVALPSGGAIQVCIAGLPFYPTEETFETHLPELDARLAGMNGFRIAVLHADMMPPGAGGVPGHWAMPSYDDVLDLLPHADYVCVGHIHHCYPLYVRPNPAYPGRTQTVAKPFSMGRVVKDYYATAEDLREQHRPAFTLIRFVLTQAGGLDIRSEYRPIPHAPFELAFVPETLERELAQEHKISFAEDMIKDHGSLENAFEVRLPKDVLATMQIDAGVRTMIDHYVNEQ